ncbi:MAG TPA: histidinol-phosphate transaminase [Steroidobacteraceae bacterium]|jgi:histidinol-phosphate aminotransferase|nr:histidinol-phosphate transaminase [Steroidobacteraceae bacterium]
MSPSLTDPGQLAVDSVRSLSPYVPGKPIEELQRELGLEDIIKLASNENPAGASPLALAAMQRALTESWLYPDGSGHALKTRLAAKLGVDIARITLGNGSNDLLVLLAEAFLQPGLEAIYSQYAFAVYPIAIQATGATGVVTPANPADSTMPLGHDLAAMSRAVTPRTRIVFIANPNNPTGTWVPAPALKAFIAAMPAHVLVALDEAYFEYTADLGLQDGVAWLDEFPNLVVLRTFSKAYGLAGVRVGYAVSHPSVAGMLNRVRQAFNVSVVGLAGACAALDDPAHVAAAVKVAVSERARVAAQLEKAGTRVLPSAGNFLLVHVGANAREKFESLLRHGVIVRPVGNYGLPEHLRVTLGTREQNDRFLKSWEA